MTAAAQTKAEFDGTKQRIDPVLVGLWISLVLVALIWVAPFVFMIFTSLKTNEAVMATGAFTPPPTYAWENYTEAWGRGGFDVTFFNSAIIAVIKVPLGLVISAMAAYALARMEIAWGKVILVAIVFGTMIPFQVMLAPLFTLVNSFGLDRHLPRHHPTLHRLRRALPGVHPARLLSQCAEGTQ